MGGRRGGRERERAHRRPARDTARAAASLRARARALGRRMLSGARRDAPCVCRGSPRAALRLAPTMAAHACPSSLPAAEAARAAARARLLLRSRHAHAHTHAHAGVRAHRLVRRATAAGATSSMGDAEISEDSDADVSLSPSSSTIASHAASDDSAAEPHADAADGDRQMLLLLWAAALQVRTRANSCRDACARAHVRCRSWS